MLPLAASWIRTIAGLHWPASSPGVSVQGSGHHAANFVAAEPLTGAYFHLHFRQRLLEMGAPPAGISDAVWLSWPAEAREFILDQQGELRAQQEEVEQLRAQLTALATEVASLRVRNGRSSRNSSKPLSSDGPGYCCAEALRATSPPNDVKAVAASAAVSRAIPAQARSCCRSSG